jgi:hypothetical protein
MKTYLKKILKYLTDASKIIFSYINNFSVLAFKNLILKPVNAIIFSIIVLIFIFYQSLTNILDFTILGTEFTFGQDLTSAIAAGFSLTWSWLISLIQSFKPAGPIGIAFEIITESIAFMLFILGYIISFLMTVLSLAITYIFKLGLYNIVVILSWLYLIGLYIYLYDKLVFYFPALKRSKLKLLDKSLPTDEEESINDKKSDDNH